MANEIVLKNARIVLADEVVSGSILIRDGKIAAIDQGNVNGGEDMDGDYVIPGLIELHTDQLESHYAPRPKVRWNVDAAVQAHDAQVAASGITTVFDAMRVGSDYDRDFVGKDMRLLADAIESGVRENRLRADHFLHLRCEVSAADCLEGFALFENDDRVKLASLMDHAPGQRQFAEVETYRTYYMKSFVCIAKSAWQTQTPIRPSIAGRLPICLVHAASCWQAMTTPQAPMSMNRSTMASGLPSFPPHWKRLQLPRALACRS
jgi:alpha-D-ribose 1-methylphosphonate 5-triphosphate diphosphatase